MKQFRKSLKKIIAIGENFKLKNIDKRLSDALD